MSIAVVLRSPCLTLPPDVATLQLIVQVPTVYTCPSPWLLQVVWSGYQQALGQ